jgi:hypothetical protein
MADYTPVNTGGELPVPLTASATIVGGQLLIVTATGTVGPASAASGLVVGVAAHDAISGQRVSVWPIVGPVHETVTTSGVTAGNALSASTAGTVDSGTLATLAAAGTLIGLALTTATAGNKCRWIGRG